MNLPSWSSSVQTTFTGFLPSFTQFILVINSLILENEFCSVPTPLSLAKTKRKPLYRVLLGFLLKRKVSHIINVLPVLKKRLKSFHSRQLRPAFLFRFPLPSSPDRCKKNAPLRRAHWSNVEAVVVVALLFCFVFLSQQVSIAANLNCSPGNETRLAPLHIDLAFVGREKLLRRDSGSTSAVSFAVGLVFQIEDDDRHGDPADAIVDIRR